MSIANFIFGNPLKTEKLESERLTKVKALAIFSSDALSSVAYATEEILLALGPILAMSYSLPIAFMIAALMIVVSTSYWQTIEAYPHGGGAFAVAHENFGEFFGLIAASALLIDYVLTVAVSLSAGASAVISAFPSLSGHEIHICFVCLLLLTMTNLRGTGEAASVLSVPTYGFIVLIFLMISFGIFKPSMSAATSKLRSCDMSQMLIILALLRAFASGCSALTGIESIAGGILSFHKPRYRNAQITLLLMAILLCTSFVGITFLANKFHVVFSPDETVISQIARKIFGSGVMYYCVQFATALILLLAANSAFAGFPRLASILGQRKYIPTRFANLGDRLAYSNGIIMLAIVATVLIYFFNGDSHSLIPLYSMGVFISFTLSQAGMVKRTIRLKEKNWKIRVLISAGGTAATTITLLVLVESKFLHGAWVIAILIPMLFMIFKKTKVQYKKTNLELDLKKGGLGEFLKPISQFRPKVVVPVSRIHKGTLSALRFAVSLSDDVVAVIVNVNQKETDRLKLNWRVMHFKIPLVILNSPYRSIINPFLDFLSEQDIRDPERGKAVVVMPSFVPGKFWQNILHNQTAAILKASLLYRNRSSEQTRTIVEIPYQMRIG